MASVPKNVQLLIIITSITKNAINVQATAICVHMISIHIVLFVKIVLKIMLYKMDIVINSQILAQLVNIITISIVAANSVIKDVVHVFSISLLNLLNAYLVIKGILIIQTTRYATNHVNHQTIMISIINSASNVLQVVRIVLKIAFIGEPNA